MAQFSELIITKSGQDLLAKILIDGGKLEFSRVCVSESAISEENLEQLTVLPEIKQESAVLDITKTSASAVKVEASFSNRELSAGYFMRALGLYAKDGENEVLYAASVELSGHCYMPPYNGVTVSGALIQLVTAVGNAENISFDVDPAGTATITRLSEEIAKHNSDENAHAGRFATAEHTHTVSQITDFPEIPDIPAPTAFTVETSAWAALTVAVAGRGYSAEIAAEGVTAADYPDIYFGETSIDVAANAGVIAGTADGKIVLYANEIPAVALSGAYFVRKGAAE